MAKNWNDKTSNQKTRFLVFCSVLNSSLVLRKQITQATIAEIAEELEQAVMHGESKDAFKDL